MDRDPIDPAVSARLCGACGMCCDGGLFHSVELRADDHPRQLAAVGLKLRRKKGVDFFLQPCSAHQKDQGVCSCRIYGERPARCRAFHCRQLGIVEAGVISETDALEKIRKARSQVARVNSLIDRLGGANPNRSLAHRAAYALSMPLDSARSPLHEELESAMLELESFLAQEFRTA